MVSPISSSAGGTFNLGHWREKKKAKKKKKKEKENNDKWNPNTLSFVICRDDIITAVFAGTRSGFCMESQEPMCRLKSHTFGNLNDYLWAFILQPRMYHLYLPRMPEFMHEKIRV